MILYQSDWARYPTAQPDYDTPNKSFLELASLYHEMGVQNCLFHLALIDPSIKGLDPHSDSLTVEQKSAMAIECRGNPWYYFREVVKIPPNASNEVIPFAANRGNIGVFWSYFNNLDVGLTQPRQTGKSTSTDTLMIWLIYIGAVNSRIVLITKDDKLRKENVDRLKKIRDRLPKWLFIMSNEDSDNKYELSCSQLSNRYLTLVGQNSESAANGMGRGHTAPTMHFDESPFTPFIGDTVPAALAAGVAVREEAARNNQPYGNIFTTTAGKKDDRDGKYVFELFNRAAVWTESFFDAVDKEELKEMVRLNGGGDKFMVNITLSHRQLGYKDEWLKRKLIETESRGEKADRDFFNRWTSGSQRSPFTVAIAEVIRESQREVLYMEKSPDRYVFRWYIKKDEIEERMKNGKFIIGLDTSDAGPGDGVAMVLVDAYDLSVVGAGTYTETNLIRLSNYIVDFMVRYENTTLIVENRSSGQTFLDNFFMIFPKHGIDPFRRLYNRIVDNKDQHKEDWELIRRSAAWRTDKFYDSYKKSFGFVTGKDNRELLTDTVLQNSAKTAGHMIRDKTLINELLALEIRNGRVDHPSGGHDDHVIAWLMTHWFLTYSKNLSEYGIPADYALRGLRQLKAPSERTHQEERAIEKAGEQDVLVKEIESLTDEIRQTRNEIIQMKLEHKLRVLVSRLSYEKREIYSVDELMRSTREEKKKLDGGIRKPYRAMDRSVRMPTQQRYGTAGGRRY